MTYGQGGTMERSKTPEDPQPQRGRPGKEAPAAAGRQEELPREAPNQPEGSRVRYQEEPKAGSSAMKADM